MHCQSLFHDISPAPLSSDKQCESLCRWFIFEENLNWPNFFRNWQASIEGIGKSIEFSRQIISFNTFYAIFSFSGKFPWQQETEVNSKGNNLNPLFDAQDLKSPVRNKTNIKTCTNAINRVDLLWCNTSSKAPLAVEDGGFIAATDESWIHKTQCELSRLLSIISARADLSLHFIFFPFIAEICNKKFSLQNLISVSHVSEEYKMLPYTAVKTLHVKEF